MSLLSQAILAERYGLRLTVEQLADALGMAKNTIYNQVSAGTFAVPTYLDGGKRFADYRDVAVYMDSCRARASTVAYMTGYEAGKRAAPQPASLEAFDGWLTQAKREQMRDLGWTQALRMAYEAGAQGDKT